MANPITAESAQRLAQALLDRRQQLGLTREQVCASSGLEEYQVEYLESGAARQIDREDLRFIGIALGGIVDDLYAACGWNPGEIRAANILRSLHITHERRDKDAWVCICGNTPSGAGFYPIDNTNHEVEPTSLDWTTDEYFCNQCGRVIDMSTLAVTRRIDVSKIVRLDSSDRE